MEILLLLRNYISNIRGTSITGTFIINGGDQEINTVIAINGMITAQNIYNQLSIFTPCIDISAFDLGGLTLTPSCYFYSSSSTWSSGTLTLDGTGVTNPFFIIRTGSTLITPSASNILLINVPIWYILLLLIISNVFFIVGLSATLGITTQFNGNIIALQSITLNTGATNNGKLIALNGAITLDTNIINNCNDSICQQNIIITGACCLPNNGSCIQIEENQCINEFKGFFNGNNTICNENSCRGSCCFQLLGGCTDNVNIQDCGVGRFNGFNTTCSNIICPINPEIIGSGCNQRINETFCLSTFSYNSTLNLTTIIQIGINFNGVNIMQVTNSLNMLNGPIDLGQGIIFLQGYNPNNFTIIWNCIILILRL